MINLSTDSLSVSAAENGNSNAIKTDQLFKVSAQVISGSGTSSGTVQLQVSNDVVHRGITPEPTNWSNLGSAITISGAAIQLITATDICYNWLRAVFTDTFNNVSTITAVADVAGSLNNTYFLASSITADYYFWFDNGSGVDPAVAGRTAIHVTYTDNDTAATIGGLIRTAAASKGWTVTGAGAQVILTNTATGPSTIASDGTVPTGFTISNTQPTATITVNLCFQGV